MGKLRRIWFMTLPAAVVGGIAWLILTQSKAAFSPPGELVKEKDFVDYQVKMYRRDEESLFEKICHKLPPRLESLCRRIHRESLGRASKFSKRDVVFTRSTFLMVGSQKSKVEGK